MSVYKGDDIIAGTSVGFVRELAWSAKQQISSVPFTAPKDGMIIGTCAADGTGSDHADYYLNEVPIGTSHHVRNDYCAYANMTIPVKAGDVFSAAEWSLPYSALWFVPYEYSTVSDINVITPEYIRNMFTPDWSAATPVTSMPYTATKRGVLSILVNDLGNGGGVIVNGVNAFRWDSGNNNGLGASMFPLNVGDFVTLMPDTRLGDKSTVFIPYKVQ